MNKKHDTKSIDNYDAIINSSNILQQEQEYKSAETSYQSGA
jgi:hypothetical protein